MRDLARPRMDPERRREQLLDVAAICIAEHGVDVSLDDVARAAGVSPPLMRHYFKNRDGLLVALVQCAIEEILGIWTDPDGGDLTERLARYLEWVAVRPWAHRLWVAAPSKELVLAPLVADARRRLMGAALEVAFEEQSSDQRSRSNAWVAVIESTLEHWLEDGPMTPGLGAGPGRRRFERAGSGAFLCDYTRDELVELLLDAGTRLEIPAASLVVRA